MTEIRRDGGRETWVRLREWDKGQSDSERFAAALLHSEGYKNIDPSHPLGGPDGGKDIRCQKEELHQIAGVFFPRGQQTFSVIKKKFIKDLEGALKNGAEGFVFITNQELKLQERQNLVDIAGAVHLTIYHLERLASILNTPSGYPARLEFLQIAMTVEEQLAFIKDRDRMFFETEVPSLDLSFADPQTHATLGKFISVRSSLLSYNSEDIPDYGNPPSYVQLIDNDNKHFYRQYADYQKTVSQLKGFRFIVKNQSGLLLSNVRIKITGELNPNFFVRDGLPKSPSKQIGLMDFSNLTLRNELLHRRYLEVREKQDSISCDCRMLDIQPQAEEISDDIIYFGGDRSGSYILEATVFGDNLPQPKKFSLTVNIEAHSMSLDIDAFLKRIDRFC